MNLKNKTNKQIAHEWVFGEVVLSEFCDIKYSDLADGLEKILDDKDKQTNER